MSAFSSLKRLNLGRCLRLTYLSQLSRVKYSPGSVRYLQGQAKQSQPGNRISRVWLYSLPIAATTGYAIYTTEPWDPATRRKIKVAAERIGRFFRKMNEDKRADELDFRKVEDRRTEQAKLQRHPDITKEADRTSRYVDLTTEELATSKNINDLKPYYFGEYVGQRMALVRESINYIREHWDMYDQFIVNLKTFFEDNDVRFADKKVQEMLETVLNGKKEWGNPDDLFHAVGLYTSEEGYNKLFSLVNKTFRSDNATNVKERMRNVVFLIELINIDLFNYCRRSPQHDNFQGTVYRGMSLLEDDFQSFTKLAYQTIDKSYIAVPLSLWSTTSEYDVAKRFISMSDDEGRKPLVMNIKVIEMKPEYMEHYRKRFPKSTVSTICAVNIKDLSMFPKEFEVLLRGAFFQVLDMYDGEKIGEKQAKVLHMVTVNSNRDHISSAHLGEDTNLARQMFGNMANISRCEYAIEYFKNKGQMDKASQFEEIMKQKKEILSKLMEQ